MNAQKSFDPFACSYRPLHTVLIGTTLEDGSDTVVRSGLAVARAAGASIYLVHSVPGGSRLFGGETGLGDDLPRELIDGCEEKLRGQVERLGIQESELAGAGVLAGVPHRVLIDTARLTGAGLIVVGATGSGPLAAELLGSTAERVLRKADCPVLLVRGEMRVPPRRVLAPVDLSSLSGDAFRCGLHLLMQLGKGEPVELRVVHALTFLELAEQRRKRGEVSSMEAERATTEELRRFTLENEADAPFRVETAVLHGEARFEILRDLADRPIDLVVLGTHGRSGPDRLMLGSVASTIARRAPCNVLLISPEAALAEGIAAAILDRTAPVWHREPVPVS
jgi:nucleotide-binding universal stress UspA family protein